MMREVLYSVYLLTALPLAMASPPNIVFSVLDDAGWNDIGYNNPMAHTPNLDTMMTEGVKLDRMYNFRFCSPSRSMYMTGRHPWKHGQHTDINLNIISTSRCGIQTDYTFLPELLKEQAGYTTYGIGKWHLGHYKTDFIPTQRGFDEYYGYYPGNIKNLNTCEAGDTESLMCKPFTDDICTCATSGGDSCRTYANHKNGDSRCEEGSRLVHSTASSGETLPQDYETSEYADITLGEEAVRMINEHDKSNPMFLYLAWSGPHTPIESPQRYQDLNSIGDATCEERVLKAKGGMLSVIDEAMGNIRAALESRSMWDNTLVIQISDNGGQMLELCDSNIVASNFPLRGGKFTFYEGGIRNIGFLSGPAIPEAQRGTTWSSLVYSTDWFRTILGAAGVADGSIPSAQLEDGYNMWTELTTGGTPSRTEIPLQVWPEAKRYVLLKEIDGQLYKYMKGQPGYTKAKYRGYLRTNTNVISSFIHPPYEFDDTVDYDESILARKVAKRSQKSCLKKGCLYNLTDDPQESKNRIKREGKVKREFQTWINDIKDTVVEIGDSGLCEDGWGPEKTFARPDVAALDRIVECGAYVPWVDVGSCPPQA